MKIKEKIKFGTSGWRGIIAKDFTFDNLKLVSQAIADYLLKTDYYKRGIIIGYDTRFCSPEFANTCAKVLIANDIQVYLTKRDTPTPVISYDIVKNSLAGGINITASHNPPEYNGLKFSYCDGAPAPLSVTNEIEKHIVKLQKNPKIVITENIMSKNKNFKYIDPSFSYFKRLRQIIDEKIFAKRTFRIIVDLFYGTGRGYLDELLTEFGCKINVIHNQRDVLFGGGFPEPSAEHLKELRSLVKKEKAYIGLSLDGDADRFGIVDRDGTFLTPNEVISLLLVHLFETKGYRGSVVRTVATTHLIDAIAKDYGVKVIETPVGFKYIGEIMQKEKIIIGGEESGGLSIGGHIPEKDGILACLLVAEMLAVNPVSLKEHLNKIYKKVGRIYSDRIDMTITNEKGKERLIDFLKKPVQSIFNLRISHMSALDGFKFYFEDGSWLLIRISGTEPKVRCYAESNTKAKLPYLLKSARKLVDKICS